VFSQQLSPCVSNIYTHVTVIVALKVNEGANASKGVEKKKQVTLTLTKKLEVWKILLIVQQYLGPSGARIKSSVYYFMDNFHKHLFFFNTEHSKNKGQMILILRNDELSFMFDRYGLLFSGLCSDVKCMKLWSLHLKINMMRSTYSSKKSQLTWCQNFSNHVIVHWKNRMIKNCRTWNPRFWPWVLSVNRMLLYMLLMTVSA